jgi:hypothetical protein
MNFKWELQMYNFTHRQVIYDKDTEDSTYFEFRIPAQMYETLKK